MEVEDALENLKNYLRIYHPHVIIDDLVITDSKGYFRMKKKCGGRGVCKQPIHDFMFNEGGTHHTISFYDNTRDYRTGKFLSPYRTWNCIKESGLMS